MYIYLYRAEDTLFDLLLQHMPLSGITSIHDNLKYEFKNVSENFYGTILKSKLTHNKSSLMYEIIFHTFTSLNVL